MLLHNAQLQSKVRASAVTSSDWAATTKKADTQPKPSMGSGRQKFTPQLPVLKSINPR